MKKAKREVTVMYPGGYVLCPGECYGTCEVLKEFLKIKEGKAKMREYIEREAVIEAIKNHKCKSKVVYSTQETMYCVGQEIGKAIRSVSAADVAEVRHGWWIEKQIPLNWCEDDVDIVYTCSICGMDDIGKCRYCPNCGAKMDKEE